MIMQCLAAGPQGSLLGLVATLGWIAVYAVLLVQYVSLRRRDRAWRERWERKHGRSLESLRERGATVIRVGRALIGIFAALILFELSTGLIYGAPMTCPRVSRLVVLGLLLLAAILGLRMAHVQRRKLDELLGHQ